MRAVTPGSRGLGAGCSAGKAGGPGSAALGSVGAATPNLVLGSCPAVGGGLEVAESVRLRFWSGASGRKRLDPVGFGGWRPGYPGWVRVGVRDHSEAAGASRI